MAPMSVANDAELRTAYRTCPLCEAGCGLEITLAGRRRRRASAATATTCSATASSARRARRSSSCTRTPTASARRSSSATAGAWRRRGTRRSPRSSGGCCPIIDAHGRDSAARLPRQPERPQPRRAALRPVRCQGRSAPRNLFSASTVDQRPKELSAGLDVRLAAHDPGARRRPHRLPAHARRQPVRVERQPGHRARLAGPHRGDASPRRPARRRRPASQPHRRGGRRAPLHPARHRRVPARWRSCTRCSTKASSTSARLGRPRRRARRGRAARERVHARSGRAGDRHRRGTRSAASPASSRPRRRRACTAASAPRTQEFGTLASWLVDVLNVLTGNLDRPGGAMFTDAGGRRRPTPAARRASGAACGSAGARAGCAACPRRSASCRPSRWPRRSRRRARARSGRWSRSPATRCCRPRTAAAGSTPRSTSLEFMVSVDIYVNETTRHADVILPVARSRSQKSHYDVALLQLAIRNVANYSPPVLPLDDGQLDEWEVLAKLALDRPGHGRRRGPGGRRRPRDPRRSSTAPSVTRPGRCTGATPTSPRRRWSRGGARSGCSTSCCARGPYGEDFGGDPDGLSLDVLLANPHGIDLGPLEPRLPDVLRTPAGMIELAPEPLVADLARLEAALDQRVASCRRRPRPRSSSAAATCARTTRGCTTSTCS